MISTDPFQRLLAERNISLSMLSQLTEIPVADLSQMQHGKYITPKNLDKICRILNCQPSDIIEFTMSETKGHWQWVESVK